MSDSNLNKMDLNNNELTELNFRKMIFAIKYTDYVPDVLSYFCSPKTILLNCIENGLEDFKPDLIINDNNVTKNMNILEKKFLKDIEVINCLDKLDKPLNNLAPFNELLTKIMFAKKAAYTAVQINFEVKCDLYIYTPRGNYLSIKNVTLNNGSEFQLQNVFNAYELEGFVLAIKAENYELSFATASLGGAKGSGDLLVIAKNNNTVYIDSATKYLDTSAVLAKFKG